MASSRAFIGLRRASPRPSTWLIAAACVVTPGVVRAQQEPVDGLPGSPRPPGVSISPEAPPTPPAPGGRAPSFGTRSDPDAWVFRLGGRFSAWGRVGIGRTPAAPPPSGYSGTALHTPPLIAGPDPIYPGTAATLNFQYGNQTVMAFTSFEAALNMPEWAGYQRTEFGPRIRSAYVLVTPAPIGPLRTRFQVGAFPAHYGAPGPWGWGTFGPVLAIHGYGGIAAADYDFSPNTVLSLEYGVSAVPEVPEGFVRGTYTQWPETGLSTIVNHAHLGLSFKNKYFARLHLAHADGRNMRTYLDDDPVTPEVERGNDGRIHVAALELRWVEDPYGQLGVTPVVWNFDQALSVHDGIWWALGWTAGGREMTFNHLGVFSGGNGRVAAVSAEYTFSLSRILAYPEPFDGNGRDLRVALAFMPHWTLATTDPSFERASGYFLGATFQHVLLSWFSTTYRVFGQSRDAAIQDVTGTMQPGRWGAYNVSLGLALHSDWQSQDRMELLYSRYFYSDFADNNPAQPLDRDVVTLGASLAF